jgi:hypothetical protein
VRIFFSAAGIQGERELLESQTARVGCNLVVEDKIEIELLTRKRKNGVIERETANRM